MKDFFSDRIEFLQFPFHMAPLWPNDPKTSILVRRRGSDSDGPACVDGARVSVQEPVTFRDLDISISQEVSRLHWITLLKPRDMSIYYLAAQNLAKLQAANCIPRLRQ